MIFLFFGTKILIRVIITLSEGTRKSILVWIILIKNFSKNPRKKPIVNFLGCSIKNFKSWQPGDNEILFLFSE